MKTTEVIGYGLLAYFGYKLLIKPRTQTVTPGTSFVPQTGTAYIAPGTTTNTSLVPTITNTAQSLISKIFPSTNPAPAPTVTAPDTGTTYTASTDYTAPSFDPSAIYTGNGPGDYSTDTEYFQSLEEDELMA